MLHLACGAPGSHALLDFGRIPSQCSASLHMLPGARRAGQLTAPARAAARCSQAAHQPTSWAVQGSRQLGSQARRRRSCYGEARKAAEGGSLISRLMLKIRRLSTNKPRCAEEEAAEAARLDAEEAAMEAEEAAEAKEAAEREAAELAAGAASPVPVDAQEQMDVDDRCASRVVGGPVVYGRSAAPTCLLTDWRVWQPCAGNLCSTRTAATAARAAAQCSPSCSTLS